MLHSCNFLKIFDDYFFFFLEYKLNLVVKFFQVKSYFQEDEKVGLYVL